MFTEKKRKSRSRLSQFFSFFPSIQTCSTVFGAFLLEKHFITGYCIFDGKILLDVAKSLRENKISFNNYISVRGLL